MQGKSTFRDLLVSDSISTIVIVRLEYNMCSIAAFYRFRFLGHRLVSCVVQSASAPPGVYFGRALCLSSFARGEFRILEPPTC